MFIWELTLIPFLMIYCTLGLSISYIHIRAIIENDDTRYRVPWPFLPFRDHQNIPLKILLHLYWQLFLEFQPFDLKMSGSSAQFEWTRLIYIFAKY